MKKKWEMEWKQLISMFWWHEIVLSQISKPVAETTVGTQQTHPTVYEFARRTNFTKAKKSWSLSSRPYYHKFFVLAVFQAVRRKQAF